MVRSFRLAILIVGCVLAGGWQTAAPVRAAPAWEGGGRPYEVSDLPSVVIQPPSQPPGQPPLPPEPVGSDSLGLEQPGLPAPEGVVAEEETLPSLSERIGSFVPDAPGLLTYDSAAAIEPDGRLVAGSKWAGLGGWTRCLGDGCWIVRAEAIALWRNAPASRPLFTSIVDDGFGNPALGPVVLNANQLTSDPLAAGRLTLGRVDSCGRGIELGYLYAGTFYAARSLPYVTDGYALANPGIYGNPWGIPTQGSGPDATPISAAQTQLTGRLQSLEANWREPLGWGATRFLIGFRWLQWQEAWLMADQFNDPNNPGITGYDGYSTTCINDLYGGQIGFDAVLWNPGQGFRLESVVKAGAYYNRATQTSGFVYPTTLPFDYSSGITVAKNPATCSFVGELGITAVMPLHKNLDLRCGYFGLWLDSIAQPTNQLSHQDLAQKVDQPATGSLVANGLVVLQGVSLGLEGRW